jgi:hypothetical protein
MDETHVVARWMAVGLLIASFTTALLVTTVPARQAMGLGTNTTASTATSEGQSPGLSPQQPQRIVLFGDSLVSEAGQDFEFLATLAGASVHVHTFPGTAPCDFFAAMTTEAQDWKPTTAVLAFTGDAFTPCMAGVQLGTPAYFTKYKDDMQTAISIFRSVGARVVLIGLPADASANLTQNASALNQIYQSLATGSPGVSYADAGQAVLANGHFTWTLPCLPGEPCTGPNGTNVVRAPDGVHFCPNGKTTLVAGFEECDVYSSGALRFASAMVTAALAPPEPSVTRTKPHVTCPSEHRHGRVSTARSNAGAHRPPADRNGCRTSRSRPHRK